MTELKLDKKTAKELYPESPEWFRKVLTATFGSDYFKKKNFDEIKTLEDAAEATNHTVAYLKIRESSETQDEWAYRMLKMVVKAINGDWTPDWSNSDQYKYWPYFILSSGFGFSYSDFVCDLTNANVGSRLCFETREKSNYAAQQFIDIYEQFMTIKK
jgi:hypothetical protein